jgi:uncharacterized protein YggE
MVDVTIRDIDAVGKVIDAATVAGATNVNGISFSVADPSAAVALARSAAVADAQARATQWRLTLGWASRASRTSRKRPEVGS